MDTKTLLDKASEHYRIKLGRMNTEEQERVHDSGNPFTADYYKLEELPKPCHQCSALVTGQRTTYVLRVSKSRDEFWEMKCNRCEVKKTANSLQKILRK